MRTTEESRKQIVDMYNIGATYDEIVKTVGVSYPTISKVLRDAGVLGKRQNKPVSFALDADLQEWASSQENLGEVLNSIIRAHVNCRIADLDVVGEELSTSEEKMPYSETEGTSAGDKMPYSETDGSLEPKEWRVTYYYANESVAYECEMLSTDNLLEVIVKTEKNTLEENSSSPVVKAKAVCLDDADEVLNFSLK